MKISILLPYKENFSSSYAGAVSLFLNDIIKLSKYKKFIKIYGSTNYKKDLLSNKYVNFHPLVNTATINIKTLDFIIFWLKII